MNQDIKNLSRLMKFREKQREAATADMNLARQKTEEAMLQHEEAKEEMLSTSELIRSTTGQQINIHELELYVRSAYFAAVYEAQKNAQVQVVSQQEDKTREKLKECHIKVQQIKTLKDIQKTKQEKENNKKEQSLLDDLAAIKGILK